MKKERNIKFYEEQQARVEFERKLLEREAWNTLNSLLRRLEANSLKLKDIEMSSYSENDYGNGKKNE